MTREGSLDPPATIRPYAEGDREQLPALFRRCFNKTVSAAHLDWKHKARWPEVPNRWVALQGERLIGGYTGLPIELGFMERGLRAMIAVDGMVHPDYRRRGVLTQLVTRAHQSWTRHGVGLVLGLPNHQWGSRREALAWRYAFPLKWKLRPLKPGTLLAGKTAFFPEFLAKISDRLAGFGLPKNGSETTGSPVLDPAAALVPHRPAHSGKIRPSDDPEWVTWRYLEEPGGAYRLIPNREAARRGGFAVYRIDRTPRGNIGFIADLAVAPGDAASRTYLLNQIMRAFYRENVVLAATLAVPGSAWNRQLNRRGFLFSWGAFDVNMVLLDPELSWRWLKKPAHWSLPGGLFDVV